MNDVEQTTKPRSDQERLTEAYRDQRDRAIGQLAAAQVEIERLRSVIEDALGRYQVTHIHAALKEALANAAR